MSVEYTKELCLNETGKEINKAIERIIDALTVKDDIYGFIEHMDVLSPSQRIEWTDKNADYTTPLTVNFSNGSYSLGSWAGFPALVENKPYMVRPDGTPDYQLDENDYTKKADGTASDVANANYNGGAFSWMPRVYKYEAINGTDRIVKFSFVKRPGFDPVGFLDEDNNELTGRWIPMFYTTMDAGGASIATKAYGNCVSNYNTSTERQYELIQLFHRKAKFFAGAFVETLIDLMFLLTKTTNLQEALGYGNSQGQQNTSPYGMKDNAVIGGGQFYGTSDKRSLNKIFHSIVLGSYQQRLKDPYEVVKANGHVFVSPNYHFSVEAAEGYIDTGIIGKKSSSAQTMYPLYYRTVKGYGSLPDINGPQGSTSEGPCDQMTTEPNNVIAITLRFGQVNSSESDAKKNGPRFRMWNRDWGDIDRNRSYYMGFSVMLDGKIDNK